MNLGVSTACFYPLETELSLEKIGKAGVKHTEIFFNALCELKQSFVDMLLDIKEELDFCNKHDLDVLIEVKRKDELINSINKLRTFGYI